MSLNYKFFEKGDVIMPHILSGCSNKEINQFLAYCSLKECETGESIIHASSSETCVYYILKGCVKVSQCAESGREINFAYLYAGESFGELAAIDNMPRSAFVQAQNNGLLLVIRRDEFLSMLSVLPKVNYQLLLQLAHMIRENGHRIMHLATLPSRRRIHMELRKLSEAVGTTDGIMRLQHLPKGEEMASQVACTREVVSREMSFLKKIGVIRKCDGYYEIQADKLD